MNGVQLKAWRKRMPRGSDAPTARHSSHYTQQELADCLGVSLRTVAGWETGTKPISKVVVAALRHLRAKGKK